MVINHFFHIQDKPFVEITFVLLELENDWSFPSIEKDFDSGKGNHRVF